MDRQLLRDLEDREERMNKKLIWTAVFTCVGTILLNAIIDSVLEK